MEYAFKFESPEDFNARESRKLNLINLETRRALIYAATQTLFSAVAKEKMAVDEFALENSQPSGAPNLTHYIEWGRGKNEFITDSTVSCKLAERINKKGLGEGKIYEILFPLNGTVKSADYLLDNFDNLVNENEFYVVKSYSDDPLKYNYFYINETGIAEYEPFGLEQLEREIELAFFIENKNNIPLPILTAEREMRLYANLIEMKLVPYKISNL